MSDIREWTDVAHLKKMAISSDINRSGDAIRRLAELARLSETALNELISLLDYSDSEQVATYALAKVERSSPKIVDAMVRRLSSGNSYVRKAAFEYFGEMETVPQEALDAMKALLINRMSTGNAEDALDKAGLDVDAELEKHARSLSAASVVRGIWFGWIARNRRQSLAGVPFSTRVWGALVATLLLGGLGTFMPWPIDTRGGIIAFGVVIGIGALLCAFLSFTYRMEGGGMCAHPVVLPAARMNSLRWKSTTD